MGLNPELVKMALHRVKVAAGASDTELARLMQEEPFDWSNLGGPMLSPGGPTVPPAGPTAPSPAGPTAPSTAAHPAAALAHETELAGAPLTGRDVRRTSRGNTWETPGSAVADSPVSPTSSAATSLAHATLHEPELAGAPLSGRDFRRTVRGNTWETPGSATVRSTPVPADPVQGMKIIRKSKPGPGFLRRMWSHPATKPGLIGAGLLAGGYGLGRLMSGGDSGEPKTACDRLWETLHRRKQAGAVILPLPVRW